MDPEKNGISSLEVRNLNVTIHTGNGALKAVNDVSFTLQRGEVLGMVGESACGKSMTALSVLRLLPRGGRVSGEVYLSGEDLFRLPRHRMRRIRGKRIGMIFQDPNTTLNPVRTIGTQFLESLAAHLPVSRHIAYSKALNMLSSLGLAAPDKIMKRYPFQLSGGMRQRVIIALALSLEPDFLIADEPTTALDVTIQAQILSEMKRLKDVYGTGILLISHNMGVIAQLSDRVAVMYAGSILESGPAKDLFHNPAHPYTRGLLGSVPDLCQSSQLLLSIGGQPPALHNLPEGCPFSPRCDRTQERCHREYPPTAVMEGEHRVACFLPHERVNHSHEQEGKEVEVKCCRLHLLQK
jgi:oligopeptide/dipeptide ABC transporter ATP-binding protein